MKRDTLFARLPVLLIAGLLLLLCACGTAETATPVFSSAGEPLLSPVSETEITPLPTVDILGVSYPADTEVLDLSAMAAEDTAEAAAALAQLPALRTINLLTAEGECPLSAEKISLLAEAAPEADIRCGFPLWGEFILSDAEEVTFSSLTLGVSDLAELRDILPYLHCTRFALNRCRVDNEAMAALRQRFPERGIAWDIKVDGYWHMTDCERIRTTIINNDYADLLRYFTEVRYLDVGHKQILTNFEFLRSMPHLQVAILAMTGITDLSVIENCTELEYLEIFSTNIRDLSPLAGLTKLKHLNISNMPYVKDITPLFSLTALERLRGVQTYVPEDQIEEITALLPECTVQFRGYGPTSGGWRTDTAGNYTERYAQLREEMEYDVSPWPNDRW